jgi:hypothetical protein
MAVKRIAVSNRGVMPDYPVQPTLSEFIHGEDVELKYAFKIVKAAASVR